MTGIIDISDFLGLAIEFAGDYTKDYDDRYDLAIIGLMAAAEKYDPSRTKDGNHRLAFQATLRWYIRSHAWRMKDRRAREKRNLHKASQRISNQPEATIEDKEDASAQISRVAATIKNPNDWHSFQLVQSGRLNLNQLAQSMGISYHQAKVDHKRTQKQIRKRVNA